MSRFAGGVMMAVGFILAATTGLCSLYTVSAMLFLLVTNPAEIDAKGGDIAIPFIVVGLAIAAFGLWLFRRGLARVQERDE